MTEIPFTLAARDYDRTRALIDGKVHIQGVDLTYIQIESFDAMFSDLLSSESYDCFEFSLSSYFVLRSQGNSDFISLPIFPSRMFRHSNIFYHADSGISEPLDLAGKRVGIFEWQQTAAVWIRGILQDEYDLPLKKIHWIKFISERCPLAPIKDFDIEDIGLKNSKLAAETANDMLDKNDLDALIWVGKPKAFEKNNTRIKRLFEKWSEIEIDYYLRNKIFPIMHILLLRRKIYESYQWLSKNLVKAFSEAKDLAYRALAAPTDNISCAWIGELYEKQSKILGSDPYPYNLQDNRKVLETFLRYQREQGIIANDMRLEDQFTSASY